MELLSYLREFNTPSVLLRLTMAVLCGGMIGVNREHKRRPAGFRTYMLVCLGAALTMILGQYQHMMFGTVWKSEQLMVGMTTDVTRFGAQVINGIGFLGTGTILITEQREVKGLTTAAGLWACACMGLAIGAGFYEGMLLGFGAIFLSIKVLPYIEGFLMARSRNMNLYVEFTAMERMQDFIRLLKDQGIQIYDVEIDRRGNVRKQNGPSVVFYLHLPKYQSHTRLLADLSYSPDVRTIDEI
ncbi:MAG: MgtC/SapB family protein [Lawsonibacter sp.]|jgi:putative Mg2+ transporter-C (MgtC) family protein|nr:MgtC/SapB family protein [Lawsonibacter sp.]